MPRQDTDSAEARSNQEARPHQNDVVSVVQEGNATHRTILKGTGS